HARDLHSFPHDALPISWLVVSARDETWKKIKLRVENIDARLVDHEIDHLDGTLFIDRMDATSKLYVIKTDEEGEEYLVEITRSLDRKSTRLNSSHQIIS